MPTLRIDLQEGFGGDEVVIEVDGREVFREANVRTDMRVGRAVVRPGRAAYHEADVPEGRHTVTVKLPRRNLSADIDVAHAGATYLGVSVEGAGITHIISDTPMGYA